MNRIFNLGCPDGGHSLLRWHEAQDDQISPISLIDSSAFLASTDSKPLPKLNPSPDLNRPLRRPLRVLPVGERQDVLTTIQNLHKRGFADAGDWSIPLPYPQQNAITQFIPRGTHIVISVHTKYMS